MIDTDKYEGHTPAPWELMRSGPLRDDAPKDLDNWWVKLNEARAKTSGGEWMRNIGNAYMTEADAQLIADAPLLLEEVKRLRRAWQILRSRTEMSCVCFSEYPDKQDINTHELMDLAMKEAIE